MIVQQPDVAASIQRLRAQAMAAATPGAIVIQPTNPDVVYVPSYDPSMVSASVTAWASRSAAPSSPAGTGAAAITLFNPEKGWDKADMTPP